MRTGLTAAGLVLLAALILLPAAFGRSEPVAVAHTCSATDRDFIKTAQTNIAALGLWGEQYLRGEATAKEVIAQSRNAARIVSNTGPRDPSLRKTRALMEAMFTEYGRAIAAKSKRKDESKAAAHMYRAYGLANFARDVLVDARPELAKRGCNVAALL